MKALAKEKDMLEREKWDLRRQTKEATEQANILRSQMDMKENRVKELEAELTMVSCSSFLNLKWGYPSIIIWCVNANKVWVCNPVAVFISVQTYMQ